MNPSGKVMIYTALTEVFLTYVKVAFFSASFISTPFILTHIWDFVAPGLYKNERFFFMLFLLSTPILFVIGAGLVYYFIMPLACKFFLSFEDPDGLSIHLIPRVGQYLSMLMQLIFSFGLCFELPIILILIVHTGLITIEYLVEKRKYAIIISFIFAAILTPPDLLSQVCLGIPIILLYEISILLTRILQTKML